MTLIPTLFSFAKLVSTIRTLSFDQASLFSIGSEGSHSTQNDTSFVPSAKQRKKEGKRVALQAKVDELEAQNNKIAMKNEVIYEQYEKLFETLYETRRTQTCELVASVDINHHLGDMGILDKERANNQNIDQHETSLNRAASTRSRRSGGRHLLAEGLEGSKVVYRNCRDFLKQRREIPFTYARRLMTQRFLKDSVLFHDPGQLPI
ncbi:hypothetical protein ACFX2G_025486 [Malus domestica]